MTGILDLIFLFNFKTAHDILICFHLFIDVKIQSKSHSHSLVGSVNKRNANEKEKKNFVKCCEENIKKCKTFFALLIAQNLVRETQ